MNQSVKKRLLLGPQRPVTNLGDAVRAAELPGGPVAVVSAGWQEAEGDIDDVQQLLRQPLVDLRLYQRADEIFATQLPLHDIYRSRQDQLKELQRLYRLRLRQLMIAARLTFRAEGDPEMISAEQKHALSQLQALDRHHLNRVQQISRSFDQQLDALAPDQLAAQSEQVAKTVSDCETILITGGNVLVLLNRMRLFGVDRLLADKHVVAWSAGAMVLSDLVVLFHDRTPLGRRDPEILGEGAGVLPGYVLLPDAKRRLSKHDTVRTSLLSRRFSPAACVTLNSGAMMQFIGNDLLAAGEASRLTRDGRFSRLDKA
jgi:hypothetical protein